MSSTQNKASRSRGAPPLRIVAGLIGVLVLNLVSAAAELVLRVLDRPKEVPVGWAWRGDSAERNEQGFRGHRVGQGRQDDSAGRRLQVETTHPFASMPEVRRWYAVCRAILRGRQIAATGCWVTARILCATRDFFLRPPARPAGSRSPSASCRAAARARESLMGFAQAPHRNDVLVRRDGRGRPGLKAPLPLPHHAGLDIQLARDLRQRLLALQQLLDRRRA